MQTGKPQSYLDSLISILSEELEVHRQLLSLTQQERAVLSESKATALNDVISEKKYIVELLKEVERRRISLMAELGRIFKIVPKELTLRRLAELVDSETAKKLRFLREELMNVIMHLQKENDTNQQLMIHFISLVDSSIRMLNSVLYHEPTYANTGRYAMERGGGSILSGKI